MQQTLADLIIDEMSMVGRKFLGQIDKRLRQVFPHRADTVFGGCSCLLFGDFGQLPPVWISPSTPQCHVPPYQIKAVLLTNALTVLLS